jgi:hypothetical protein
MTRRGRRLADVSVVIVLSVVAFSALRPVVVGATGDPDAPSARTAAERVRRAHHAYLSGDAGRHPVAASPLLVDHEARSSPSGRR